MGCRAGTGAAEASAAPDWIGELIGDGRPPVEIHRGDCYAAGKRRRTISRNEARRLTSGLRA
ncbi:DUF6233 domain-containing protein [Streptomyces sp. NPDC058371]|uniref:DUF6233 domain-containing protein n=1 Tax=Streptomyces sp. NPDC058371 TaxID=3346463 RepID=UPI0036645607